MESFYSEYIINLIKYLLHNIKCVMDKLALCSKVLYDKTIIEFKIENEHLRKEI